MSWFSDATPFFNTLKDLSHLLSPLKEWYQNWTHFLKIKLSRGRARQFFHIPVHYKSEWDHIHLPISSSSAIFLRHHNPIQINYEFEITAIFICKPKWLLLPDFTLQCIHYHFKVIFLYATRGIIFYPGNVDCLFSITHTLCSTCNKHI